MIGFSTTITSDLKKKAEQYKLIMRSFDIIYEINDYLQEVAQ
jgi:translation initiation factor IF-2